MGKHHKADSKAVKSHSRSKEESHDSDHKKSKKSRKHAKTEKKSKKHSSDKKHKRHGKDPKEVSKPDRSSNVSLPEDKCITEEDYFLKNEEFRVWCALVKKSPFEDMSTDLARKLFLKEFVVDYNTSALHRMYYEGIPHDIREATTRTNHKWKIQVSDTEKESLAILADDIDYRTRVHTQVLPVQVAVTSIIQKSLSVILF